MANTYRIRKLVPQGGNAASGSVASFEPQYSTNGGTTWTPINQIPYLAQVEAEQALGFVSGDEAGFNAQVAAGKLGVVQTYITYP